MHREGLKGKFETENLQISLNIYFVPNNND